MQSPALASFSRRPLASVAAVVEHARRIVVLEDLVDHTNIGAIFRTAAALGWDAVLVTPRCGDPLYRRAVRTSMGAVFAVPWTRLDHRTGPEELAAAGYRRVGLTPRAILARVEAETWPEGVRLTPAGEFESRQESFGGVGSAIIVAVLGVLAILVLEFRTFRSTLIVASVIPLGIVGGMLALLLSGYTLSFTATIGFVALMGIEVKNSILLVDFTNLLRRQGRPLDQAIEEAGEKRFIPILLTTLTAVGGLLPLAAERSALYSPLALVILGGLVSSSVLTRVVTPVLYKLLPPHLETDHPEPALAPVGSTPQPA